VRRRRPPSSIRACSATATRTCRCGRFADPRRCATYW
jgi:hypothetical protein